MTSNVGFLFHVHCDIKFLFYINLNSLKKKLGSLITYGGLQM